MSLRSIVKDLAPPALAKAYQKIRLNSDTRADALFDGDGALFKELIPTVRVYGEYGVGKSTVWAHANSACSILSVDTDKGWVDNVIAQIGTSDRLDMQWVDLGEIGDWGRPKTYAKRASFPTYAQSIWTRSQRPDLVLIDGRFRVSCFLHSLENAKPGAKILFDDYVSRSYYHVVEEYLRPTRFCGRQALFIVPDVVDHRMIREAIAKFEYVMD